MCQYFPISSLYWWKGKIVDENEFVLIAIGKANFEKVKNEVEKIHSYTIPCIVKIPVSSNKKLNLGSRPTPQNLLRKSRSSLR